MTSETAWKKRPFSCVILCVSLVVLSRGDGSVCVCVCISDGGRERQQRRQKRNAGWETDDRESEREGERHYDTEGGESFLTPVKCVCPAANKRSWHSLFPALLQYMAESEGNVSQLHFYVSSFNTGLCPDNMKESAQPELLMRESEARIKTVPESIKP